jgi:hypothetical protein
VVFWLLNSAGFVAVLRSLDITLNGNRSRTTTIILSFSFFVSRGPTTGTAKYGGHLHFDDDSVFALPSSVLLLPADADETQTSNLALNEALEPNVTPAVEEE